MKNEGGPTTDVGQASSTRLIPAPGKHIVEFDPAPWAAERSKRLRHLQSTSSRSPPRGSGTFKISYKFLSSVTSAQQASFEYAAQRLSRIITTKHTIVTPGGDERCDSVPNEILPQIDGLFIYVKLTTLDGVNGILGQAGPCLLDENGFPRVGYVEFDVADVNNMINQQTFDAVCVHEISHILGFGTLWRTKSLLGGTSSDPRFIGSKGIAALSQINGTFMGTPAVQDTGGSGTAGSHWRETSFGDEMMTPYLSASYQPISALTIESLRDIGYNVDSSAADNYVVLESGYNTPNTPFPGMNPIVPRWFTNYSSSFWNSTTIWIIACVGGAAVIIALSVIYSRIKRVRRPQQVSGQGRKPTPISSRDVTSNVPAPTNAPDRFPRVTSRSPLHSVPVYSTPAQSAPPIPVAIPISNSSQSGSVPVAAPSQSQDRSIPVFMDVTNCRDRRIASEYLQLADGNVSLAIGRYLEQQNRSLANI